MKHARLKRYWIFFTLLILLPLTRCGGAAPPPASIPAPVSSLLSITPPDPTGGIDITGAPGSVLPGANVQAQNVTQVGPFTLLKPRWEWLSLVRTAHAQTFFVQVTADDQGAFFLRIDGQTGDIIAIRQEVGGEFSPETQLTVP